MLHGVEKGDTPFLCETCFVRRSSILEKRVTCLYEANDNNNFLHCEMYGIAEGIIRLYLLLALVTCVSYFLLFYIDGGKGG